MLLFVTPVAAAPRAGVGTVRARRSIPVDVEDRFGEGLRRCLRQIVPDAAREHPVRVDARELLGVRPGVRVRRPIGRWSLSHRIPLGGVARNTGTVGAIGMSADLVHGCGRVMWQNFGRVPL
jgi:hypothetical protein